MTEPTALDVLLALRAVITAQTWGTKIEQALSPVGANDTPAGHEAYKFWSLAVTAVSRLPCPWPIGYVAAVDHAIVLAARALDGAP